MTTRKRSSPMGSDRVISFKATQEIHTSLAGLAAELGVSMSEAIRIALETYIEQKGKFKSSNTKRKDPDGS